MHFFSRLIFLTFVLYAMLAIHDSFMSPVYAAKKEPSPDIEDHKAYENQEKNEAEPNENIHPASPSLKSTIDIAEPPPLPEAAKRKRSEYFYPFRQALTVRMGQTAKTYGSDDFPIHVQLGGVLYLYQTSARVHYEGGADLLSDGSGALHFGERFVFSKGAFRPYGKLAVGVRIIPKDQLATFLRFEYYQFRAAAGFEALIYRSNSLRLETELIANQQSSSVGISLGYVSAW